MVSSPSRALAPLSRADARAFRFLAIPALGESVHPASPIGRRAPRRFCAARHQAFLSAVSHEETRTADRESEHRPYRRPLGVVRWARTARAATLHRAPRCPPASIGSHRGTQALSTELRTQPAVPGVHRY